MFAFICYMNRECTIKVILTIETIGEPSIFFFRFCIYQGGENFQKFFMDIEGNFESQINDFFPFIVQLEWLTGGECLAGMHEVVVTNRTTEAIQLAQKQNRSLWRVSSTVCDLRSLALISGVWNAQFPDFFLFLRFFNTLFKCCCSCLRTLLRMPY